VGECFAPRFRGYAVEPCFTVSPVPASIDFRKERTMKVSIANPERREMDKFLNGVVGVVVASSFEQQSLWDHWHRELGKPWVSGGGGPMIQVGEIGDMPVCCALTVDEVDGQRILFIDETSQVRDSRMVEKWLEDNAPLSAFENGDPRKRLNQTDPNNFHIVVQRSTQRQAA
jgi:hypothetical protein